MDMKKVDKTRVGLVRPIKRWSEATQRRSLAEAGFESAVVLGEIDDAVVLGDVRERDTVAIYELHLLASREPGAEHPHTRLFWWVGHLVRRRVIIVETATGASIDTANIEEMPALLDRTLEAVRTISAGYRGRAAHRQPREGAAKGGRKPFDPQRNRAEVEALHYKVPGDKGYIPDGPQYVKRLRRLGWGRSKAFDILGPRSGR